MGDGPRRIRRAAVPAARRRGSRTLGWIQGAATRRHARGLPRGDASRAGDLPARVRLPGSSVDSGLVVAAVPASSRHPQRHGAGDRDRRLRSGGCALRSADEWWCLSIATLATTLPDANRQAVSVVGRLPDPIEAYLRPVGSLTSFSFFPWAGFVFAGALLGVLLDAVRSIGQPGVVLNGGPAEPRVSSSGGVLLAVLAYGASFLPTPYARSDFWTSSPAFFFLRLGLLIAAIGIAYAWERRPAGKERWSPLQQLGRTSLFIYWIHVEMVYGLLSLPLHHALTLRQTWLALALFSVFMLFCSIGKDRLVARREARRESQPRSFLPSCHPPCDSL